MLDSTIRQHRGFLAGAALIMVALAACSSSNTTNTSLSSPTPTPSPTVAAVKPGTMFSTASVPGLGTVLVDANGRTVYMLSADGHSNLPCDDASGCTATWPDLPLPKGTTSATAGSGVNAAMLKTKKLADGETYPTYNGWLMYEYSGDTGPGQGNGEGLKSFGGTWYALDASGAPILKTSSGGSSSGNPY